MAPSKTKADERRATLVEIKKTLDNIKAAIAVTPLPKGTEETLKDLLKDVTETHKTLEEANEENTEIEAAKKGKKGLTAGICAWMMTPWSYIDVTLLKFNLQKLSERVQSLSDRASENEDLEKALKAAEDAVRSSVDEFNVKALEAASTRGQSTSVSSMLPTNNQATQVQRQQPPHDVSMLPTTTNPQMQRLAMQLNKARVGSQQPDSSGLTPSPNSQSSLAHRQSGSRQVQPSLAGVPEEDISRQTRGGAAEQSNPSHHTPRFATNTAITGQGGHGGNPQPWQVQQAAGQTAQFGQQTWHPAVQTSVNNASGTPSAQGQGIMYDLSRPQHNFYDSHLEQLHRRRDSNEIPPRAPSPTWVPQALTAPPVRQDRAVIPQDTQTWVPAQLPQEPIARHTRNMSDLSAFRRPSSGSSAASGYPVAYDQGSSEGSRPSTSASTASGLSYASYDPSITSASYPPEPSGYHHASQPAPSTHSGSSSSRRSSGSASGGHHHRG